MFINVSLIRRHQSSSLDIKAPPLRACETVPIKLRGRGQERVDCRGEEVKRFVRGAEQRKAFIRGGKCYC